ncbi:uncharacterized protein [Nicotiana sylvestris]|uniref:uncharacterized protein n=1 Tax=Nicotiana sylvestris TaxID=4096 RepID=UPI00388C6871
MSLKIKEKVTKQVKVKVLKVVEYPTWLTNIVPVPKKDGKKAVKGQELADDLAENPVDGEYEPLEMYFPDEDHPDKNFIDPIPVNIHDQPAYYAHVKEEADGKPWFHDIKEYLYRRTPDLGLLRCVGAREAFRLLEEIHVGTCGPHMNSFALTKKILQAGYFWITMETDCVHYVRKCHRCQIHADMIKVPPNELNATSSPWLFAAWGMDVIETI